MNTSKYLSALLALAVSSDYAFSREASPMLQPSPSSSLEFQFSQGAVTSRFYLSPTEICTRKLNGELVISTVPSAQNDGKHVRALASDAEENNLLVFYPAGQQGVESARHLLDNRFVIRLKDGAALESVMDRLGIASGELNYPGSQLAICEEVTANDFLEKLDQIKADPEIKKVEPLFHRMLTSKQVPSEAIAPAANPWYFSNPGGSGSVEGEDARLLGAYVSPSGLPDPANPTAIKMYNGSGIVIAVVDDGIAPHPEFYMAGDPLIGTWTRPPVTTTLFNSVLMAQGLNLNPNLPNESILPFPTRIGQTHGTAVAGILGASSNGSGIAGVAYNSTLIPIRLTAGVQTPDREARALTHLLTAGADAPQIYNNSWGADDTTTSLSDLNSLVEDALQTGVTMGRNGAGAIYVFPAGNGAAISDYSNYDGYANSRYTIAVGAFTDVGSKANYSEEGANLVVCGPSGGGTQALRAPTFTLAGFDPTVFVLPPDLFYDPVVPNLNIFFSGAQGFRDDFTGTSAAVPVVSGVIALMLEARATAIEAAAAENPPRVLQPLGWRDVQEILIGTARKLDANDVDWITNAGGYNFNHKYGAGAVDGAAAVAAAETWTALAPQQEEQSIGIGFGTPTNPSGVLVPDNDGTSIIREFDFSEEPNLRVEHVVVEVTAVEGRRSDIEIVLISPSGTQSILAESHQGNDDDSISQYPFMSVRHWGEGSQGSWYVRVTDRVSGEQLRLDDIVLKIFGVPDPDTVIESRPILVSDTIIRGTQGVPLTDIMFDARGDTSLTISGLDNNLGLSFNDVTDTLSGTPNFSGIESFTIIMNSPAGQFPVIIILIIEPVSNSLGEAIDIVGRESVVAGDRPWEITISPINSLNNSDAVSSSPTLLDSETSIFGFDGVTSKFVTFNWKVSSESVPLVPIPADPNQSGGTGDRLWFNFGGDVPTTWQAFIDGEVPYDVVGVQLPNTVNDLRWIYAKDGQLSAGQDQGFVDKVELLDETEFRRRFSDYSDLSFDDPNYMLSFDSRTLWVPVEDQTRPSGNSLKASKIGNGQRVTLSFIKTADDAGVLTFDFRVSSQEGADVFRVLVNGALADVTVIPAPGVENLIENFEVSGDIPWTTARVDVPEGLAYIQIEYRKDGQVDGNSDSAWVDDFVYSQPMTFARFGGTMDGDADGDGFTDFEEYVFGGSLIHADTPKHLPSVISEGDVSYVEIPIDTSRSDIDFEIQESKDLVNWTKVTLPPGFGIKRGALETYRIPVVSTPGSPHSYFRVAAIPKSE